jgi:hypothetical protein
MFTRIPVKQEQFLLLVLDGQPASRAYAHVYGQDKSKAVCEVSGSRLLSKARVQQRKSELLAARHAASPISAAFLTGELLATAAESRALGQGSAAQACYMGVAKLHGLIVDRVQADVLVRKPANNPDSPDEMTAEAWLSDFGVTVIEHNSTATIPAQPETIVEIHQKDVEVESDDGGSASTV